MLALIQPKPEEAVSWQDPSTGSTQWKMSGRSPPQPVTRPRSISPWQGTLEYPFSPSRPTVSTPERHTHER